MCPIGGCVDIAPSRCHWLQWLGQDIAYRHPVLFSVSVVNCILSQIPLEKKTRYHLDKTLTFLKERLSDSILSLQDSTILVVVSLVILFSCLRDYTSAMVHMKGLGEMVRLRGGLESFSNSSRIYVKLSRLVLAAKISCSSLTEG